MPLDADPQAAPTPPLEENMTAVEEPPSQQAARPRKAVPSNLQFCMSILFLLVFAAFIICLLLTLMTPSWYDPPSPDEPRSVELAQQAEFRLVEELQKIREPGTSWRLRVPDDAVNAWFAIRLGSWMAHDDRPEWPTFISYPHIHTSAGGMYIAARLQEEGGWGSIVGLEVEPAIVDGDILLQVHGGLFGCLPIPSPPSALMDPLHAAAEGQDKASGLAVTHLLDGVGFPARLVLVDGRVVQFDEIMLEDGAMILTARTLPRAD